MNVLHGKIINSGAVSAYSMLTAKSLARTEANAAGVWSLNKHIYKIIGKHQSYENKKITIINQ